MSRQLYIAIFLLSLIFLSGCIEQTQPLPLKKAVIESTQYQDLDRDGIPDIWSYTFIPQSEDKVLMQREIQIRGIEKNYDYTYEGIYVRDEEDAEVIYNRLSTVATMIPNCNYDLTVILPCDSPQICYETCKSNPRCLNGMNRFPDLFNESMYDYSVKLNSIKKQSADLRAIVASKKVLTQAEYDNLLIQRNELVNSINGMMQNGLIEQRQCASDDFINLKLDLMELENVFEIDEEQMELQYFNAYNTYEVTVKIVYDFDENAVIQIDEIIPESLTQSKADIKFVTIPNFVSQSLPLIARYTLDFKKISEPRNEFGYVVTSETKNWNEVVKDFSYPSGTIRILTIENLPYYHQITTNFFLLFSNFRMFMPFGIAAGLTFFTYLLLFYFLFILLRLLFEGLLNITRHKPFGEAIYQVAGYGGKGRKENIIISIILLGAGIYLLSSATVVLTDDILLSMTTDLYLLVGTLVFTVGMFVTYFLVADILKGILLGERYFRTSVSQGLQKVLSEKEMHKAIDEMRKEITELKERVISQGIESNTSFADQFLTELSKLEVLLARGETDNAAIKMDQNIRPVYAKLHEKYSVVVDQEKLLLKIYENVEKEIKKLENLQRKAKNYDMVSVTKNWRSEIANYKEMLKEEGFMKTKKYLEEIEDKVKLKSSELEDKISKYEYDVKKTGEFEQVMENLRDEIEREIENYENLVRKAIRYDFEIETINWREKLIELSNIEDVEEFKKVRNEIKKLETEIKNESSRIETRISKMEILQEIKFTCPSCNRTTTMAHDYCEICGISLKDAFVNKENELKQKLEEITQKLIEKNVSVGNKVIATTETLINKLESDYKTKKYNTAAIVIPAIIEKINYLKEMLVQVKTYEDEMQVHLNEVEKYLEEMPNLLFEAQERGMDVSNYEKRFINLGGADLISKIIEMPPNEAVIKAKDIVTNYAKLKSDIESSLIKYDVSTNALERLTNLFGEASSLLEEALKYNIDINEYSEKIEAYDFDKMMEKINSNTISKEEVEKIVNEVSEITIELKNKIKYASYFTKRIETLNRRFEEANILLEQYKKEGWKPYEEMTEIAKIDFEKIYDLMSYSSSNNSEEITKIMSNYETIIDNVLNRLRTKEAIIEGWPEWKKIISQLIKNNEKVTPQMLTTVPAEMRPIALEKFSKETKLSVAFDGINLIRMKEANKSVTGKIEQFLEEFVSEKKVDGALVMRKDGLSVSDQLTEEYEGKEIATAFSSIILNSEKIANSTNYGIIENVILDAEDNFIATKIDDNNYLVAQSKSDVDYGAIIMMLRAVKRKIRTIIEKI
jgi:predicted regulator of Ras-like GTPase activity (Roadblock/LC7/MglB family)